jgi:hypothetical protein
MQNILTSFSSVNSIDEALASADHNVNLDVWKEELSERIEQILDRKRSSVAGREESLAAYCRLLTYRFLGEELEGKVDGLVAAMLKSIKTEPSEKEAAHALKALGLTLVTSPSHHLYEAIYPVLKTSIADSPSETVKAAAIHALSTAILYSGASTSEISSTMSHLLEIVESDGQSVDAPDSGPVVTAALEEWGLLATHLDDISEDSQDAIDAFIEQLESSDPAVQIAAGENIALCYEKSYTEQESDDDSPGSASASDEEESAVPRTGPRMIKRYAAYRRTDQLTHQLRSLSTLTSHRLSKKDKKDLHTNFADILNSVEYPTRGPRYQTALNQETGRRYGSRMVVRIHRKGVMRIDTWWKLMRLKGLRRVLGGGFVVHYEANEVVWDQLPVMVTPER